MGGLDQSILGMLKSPRIIMLGIGVGNEEIKNLILTIILSKADNEHDSGLYTRIIIRDGWWSSRISKSQMELEKLTLVVNLIE